VIFTRLRLQSYKLINVKNERGGGRLMDAVATIGFSGEKEMCTANFVIHDLQPTPPNGSNRHRHRRRRIHGDDVLHRRRRINLSAAASAVSRDVQFAALKTHAESKRTFSTSIIILFPCTEQYVHDIYYINNNTNAIFLMDHGSSCMT